MRGHNSERGEQGAFHFLATKILQPELPSLWSGLLPNPSSFAICYYYSIVILFLCLCKDTFYWLATLRNSLLQVEACN
uniref:Uncharacterized protein n=1 Tax=Anguilla anguilla TaxID=7936 RepID=A0A0E9TK91_ANGAN